MAGLRGACSLATLLSAAEGRREIRSWAAEATGREQQASGQFCLPRGLPSVPGRHPQAGTSTCCNARLPTYVTQENTCILQTFIASFFFIHPFNKHFLGVSSCSGSWDMAGGQPNGLWPLRSLYLSDSCSSQGLPREGRNRLLSPREMLCEGGEFRVPREAGEPGHQ